jgi:putative membrane protein
MTPIARQTALALAVVLCSASPGAGQGGQGAAPSLSDAEIAHVAVTANAIDVEIGKLALEGASGEAARAFARTMITDHTAVNERAGALAKRLGVTPADNAVSRSLQEGAAQAKAQLAGARGAAFDRAYVEREVAYHQAVLEALDGVLIPGARNAELRALLREVRPAIAAHLEHARSLRGSLAAGR